MNVNVSYNGFSLADAASCVMMHLPVPDLVWDMEALWKVWNEPIPAITPEAVPTDAQEEAEPVSQEAAKAVIAELEEHIRRQMPSRAKPVTYAGKEYPSIAALAKAYGLGYKTCFARLRDGLPLDAPINRHPLPRRGKPVTVNGAEYPSKAAAAKALGVPYQTLCSRIRKGQDLSMPKYADRCEPIVYQGKEYPSVEALSRATGINSRSWLYRIRHNIPLEAPWGKGGRKRKTVVEPVPEALAAPAPEPAVKPVVINSKEYQSLHEIRATPAEEMKAQGKKWKACRLGGKKYTSLNALADLADVSLGQAYVGVKKMGKWIREDEI